jgi:hypothetical protein
MTGTPGRQGSLRLGFGLGQGQQDAQGDHGGDQRRTPVRHQGQRDAGHGEQPDDGAGHEGGRIVFEGTPAELVAARSTLTGEHLAAYVGG